MLETNDDFDQGPLVQSIVSLTTCGDIVLIKLLGIFLFLGDLFPGMLVLFITDRLLNLLFFVTHKHITIFQDHHGFVY